VSRLFGDAKNVITKQCQNLDYLRDNRSRTSAELVILIEERERSLVPLREHT
jgi:hypothetical protein